MTAGARNLQHDYIGITIHDQSRQTIGLAMHQALGFVRFPAEQAAAHADRGFEASMEKCGVDLRAFIPVPHACANVRIRIQCGDAEKMPVGRDDMYRIASRYRAFGACNRARKHPGMPAQQRLFPAVFQKDFMHTSIKNPEPRRTRRSLRKTRIKELRVDVKSGSIAEVTSDVRL